MEDYNTTREDRITQLKMRMYTNLDEFLKAIWMEIESLKPRAEIFARNLYNDLATVNKLQETDPSHMMSFFRNNIINTSSKREDIAIMDLLFGHAEEYLWQLIALAPAPPVGHIRHFTLQSRADNFIHEIKYFKSPQLKQSARRFAQLTFNAMLEFRLTLTDEYLMKMIRDCTENGSATTRAMGNLPIFDYVQEMFWETYAEKKTLHNGMVDVWPNPILQDNIDPNQVLPQFSSSPIPRTGPRRRLF